MLQRSVASYNLTVSYNLAERLTRWPNVLQRSVTLGTAQLGTAD